MQSQKTEVQARRLPGQEHAALTVSLMARETASERERVRSSLAITGLEGLGS